MVHFGGWVGCGWCWWVLRTGLAELATPTTTPARLRSAATTYRIAVDTLTGTAQLAA
ncbi:hypothetical protein [Rhodococcus sp. WAY2]|uniref:hypothetical protein n=1 Tax=Rhodococcus sp. WAY2 TaxID=2663121 RepID=UPI00131FA515|nr:hypothetical protein [Rhodococcus sp. WAY2]QHE73327.1 hypothetical protein GFS60_06984 [Rhodococcus sp. WAY2]